MSTPFTSPSRLAALAALALLAGCQGGVGPLWPGRDLTAQQALGLLDGEPRPLIVDTRTRDEYARGHLPGALSLDQHQFEAWLANAQPPRDRPILAVCSHGVESRLVAAMAAERGFPRAFSLSGGMLAWPDAVRLERGEAPPVEPRLLAPPVLEVGLFEQVLVVVSGLVLKPTYMILSALLIALLWRARSRGLWLLRQSMVLFLFGEGACALNYILSQGGSDPLDLLHGLGMLGMAMLLPSGLAAIADERIVRYEAADATCAMQRFCGKCWKRDPVPCGLHRLFLFAAPAAALVALIPLSAPLLPSKPVVQVFDSQVVYAVTLPVQQIHFRLYPLLGAAAFLVSLLLLLGGRRAFAWAQRAFFAGVGFTFFSAFKFFLFHVYRHAPWWADFWEEVTELITVAGVLVGLYVFRRQLGLFGFLDRWFRKDEPRGEAKAGDAAD